MTAPHRLDRIAARIFDTPLLVTPAVAELIAANLAERFGGDMTSLGPVASLDDDGDDDRPPYALVDGIATIPVRGELINRGSWMSSMSGLTSYESLSKALRTASADTRVRGILLDFDTPGGEAAGAMETADLIREISRDKKVVAYVNSLAASAGYALAAAASEIVATPSATLGSIGVVYLHLDRSKQYAQSGVKPTLIHSGAFKVDGNSMSTLEPEARARIQARIDDVYDLFTASVGKHRPALGVAGARATEAGVYLGEKATAAGLADKVGTIDVAVKSLSRPSATFYGRAASPHAQVSIEAKGESMFGKTLKFAKSFVGAKASLSDDIKAIVDDADKAALIDQTINQFSERVEGEIEETLSGAAPGVTSKDAEMSVAMKKALGLADTATEADVLAAIEKKDTDLVAARSAKAVEEQVERAAKAEADAADLRARLEVVEAERAAAAFAKRAVELGLPEAAGDMLMKAQKGDPEAWKKLEATIKGLSAQADAGKLFAEFGDNRGSGLSASQEIANKAAELRKVRPEMTIEKARAAIISDTANRDLVKRYNDEERERIAKSRAA